MGQNCCVQRDKTADVMKQYTDKVNEEKEKEKKKKQEKDEIEKNENEETAQTIEFNVDTKSNGEQDIKPSRLSQLSDGPSDLIQSWSSLPPIEEENKSPKKQSPKKQLYEVKEVDIVVKDPLFQSIDEDSEVKYESLTS